eukprot:scaffold254_cov129-Isochrysis_galbana.AAC.1
MENNNLALSDRPRNILTPNAQRGSHYVCPAALLTRSRHPQEVFLAGLTATPRLHAVGQG